MCARFAAVPDLVAPGNTAPLVSLRHVVGAFTGRLVTRSGDHEFDALPGIAEDNDTWW